MVPIKHILYENGVKEIFRFIVPEGSHAGTYEIETPDGWDDVDSIVNIDDESFTVKDFIIGDSEKLRFMQYGHKKAFNILKSVYNEHGSDGLIHFKWVAVKDEIEYDLFKDNFNINFNKYALSYDKSMYKIEIELTKSESQNKLFNREDVTIDLFAEKDLDENDISAVGTFDIGYKKGSKIMENFYFATAGQERGNLTNESNKFYVFSKSDENELGIQQNAQSGVAAENNGTKQAYFGPFIHTDITLKSVKVSLSTFNIGIYTDNVNFFSDVYIYIIITLNGNVQNIQIPATKAVDANWNWDGGTYKGGLINFGNIEFALENSIPAGSTIDLWFVSPSNTKFKTILLNESASVSITSNLESPIVKTKAIRLLDAIRQTVKNYTSSDLNVESNLLSFGGAYYNTSISTGLYLRGLPPIYFSQKIKTSFKKLMGDGASKLLALGYDILDENVVIEDLSYFFKDLISYDLSGKLYLMEDFKIENDKDITFNTLLFGSKKYSTKKKDDIRNFNTVAEFSTPIISLKSKFDKQTDLIIDEYKIQEMIEDNSSSTNDNDDDLVLIDMVNVSDYWDTGVFDNCTHSIEGGKLMLKCYLTPFDTTLIAIGQLVEITEGLNVGTWTVLNINADKLLLSKSSGIQSGVRDTPMRYKISSLTKNRTNDGFTEDQNIKNFATSTNVRHNPKYQMARWFPFFGSGLRRKLNTELIKVTSYKNNSEAQVKINSEDLANELPGLITVGADENLGTLRGYKQTLFNGDVITISYTGITFQEFIMIYESWRYGIGEDRLQSRGYLSLNTPEGIFDAFPFGDSAFSHSKKTNVLTINAKIKGKSVDNPTLISVEQLTKDTVRLVWDFNDDYINPISRIQYSFDGNNWTTIKEVPDAKTDDVQSILFFNIMTGTDVYFRVIVTTADYYNKVSNTLMVDWQFNDWIYSEIERSIDNGCGTSSLRFQLYGTGTFEINWNFLSYPGGGFFLATDDLGNEIASVYTPYLNDSDDTVTSNHVLNNEAFVFNVQLAPTDNNGLHQLQCAFGENTTLVHADLFINIKNTDDNSEFNTDVKIKAIKKWRTPRPTDPGGPFSPTDLF